MSSPDNAAPSAQRRREPFSSKRAILFDAYREGEHSTPALPPRRGTRRSDPAGPDAGAGRAVEAIEGHAPRGSAILGVGVGFLPGCGVRGAERL